MALITALFSSSAYVVLALLGRCGDNAIDALLPWHRSSRPRHRASPHRATGNVLLKTDAASPVGFVAKVADFGLSLRLVGSQTHVSDVRQGVSCMQGGHGPYALILSQGATLLWWVPWVCGLAPPR